MWWRSVYIFLPKYAIYEYAQNGQGLKEEEISRFGWQKFHKFQVLLAMADNNL